MHDIFAITVPTFAVLLGIFLNRGDFATMREEISRRFERIEKRLDGIDSRLDRIDGDLKHFHNVTGKMEGRIEELSRR